MTAASATLSDRDAFLEVLRAADILTPKQLAKAQALAPTDTPANVAGALVTAGLLTRFQADRLLAGRTDGFVLGQHVILEQIGRGAMSRVYKAKHRTMNRPVAIKVLASELTRTAAARQNFQNGIRTAGKLAHPNIVTAYDANELHDRFYLVLEFVDGPNLEAFVQQRGPLPVGEACEYIRQAAEGLQHAHETGMVHRDIKPRNLLVARPTPAAPLTVKIADFGIPKTGRGTADFGAPEQFGAGPVDPRADLYSLGCVFYFLLTGRLPFAGGTPEEKIRRHLWEEPVPVFQLRPDVPPDVGGIVHRLMAKHLAARFGSAAELMAYLDAVCVPVALPVSDAVCFDLPAYPAYPGHDSGYLTGRAAQPTSGRFEMPPVEPSPWAQLTDEVRAGDTVPLELDDMPTPPRRSKRAPRRGSIPLWMSAIVSTSIVLLCLMGIGLVVKLLAK